MRTCGRSCWDSRPQTDNAGDSCTRLTVVTRVALVFLGLAFFTCWSRGSDVEVLNIEDGSVVGEVRPSFLGKYRNYVVGVDEANGQLALVEWGDQQSRLRIVTIRPWKVTEYTIKAGRSTIDGPMAFDFSSKRFLYSSGAYSPQGCSLIELALTGEKRTCPVPLPAQYIVSRIIPARDGLFVEAGNTGGDYFGYSVLHISLDTASTKEIHKSDGGCEAIGFLDNALCLVDRQKQDQISAKVVLIDVASGRKTEHNLQWGGYKYAIHAGYILQLSADQKTLRRISIAAPDKASEWKVPEREGYDLYGLCASRDFAVLRMQNVKRGNQYLSVTEFASGKTRSINVGSDRHSLQALTYGGANYAVVSE